MNDLPVTAPHADVDLSGPVEIAPRLWWVGHHLPGDPFQCHVYLLEHGRDSVLFDPGSALTFRHTLRKIEAVLPFEHVRWFVCHHQDPDIAGALPALDDLVVRDDARVVTHWRAAALLKHYDLRMPFHEIEANGWKLDLGGRVLEFVFTPYLHFPGAFATLDRATGTLLSSDLFGGFGEEERLYAESMDDFAGVADFHQHYMPSREILQHTLTRLERLPLKRIAPQHGRIIPEPLVKPFLARMGELDCGVFLMARQDTDVARLVRLGELARGTLRSVATEQDLGVIARLLAVRLRDFLPAATLDFLARAADGAPMTLGPADRYRGTPLGEGDPDADLLGATRAAWEAERGPAAAWLAPGDPPVLALPLPDADRDEVVAVARVRLSEPAEVTPELDEVLRQLAPVLGTAVSRAVLMRALELERDALYQQSVRDPLTGLYTRHYLADTVERLVAIHDRDERATLSALFFDVDHFKAVNDTYGHAFGDRVLEAIGRILRDTTRRADVPVRLGGEEFCVFAHGATPEAAVQLAERVRVAVSSHAFPTATGALRVTLSAGVAHHRRGEALEDLTGRADAALYEAKRAGRDRVVEAADA